MRTAPFLPRAVFAATMLAASALVAAPASASPVPDSFADLAARLLPGVVNISSSQTVVADNEPGGGGPEMPTFPPGSPFEQLFKDFLNRNHGGHGGGQDHPEARKMQSLGSGYIIDPSGVVVTNNHVIEGADEITVHLEDGTDLKATVIGKDERTDIAVLQVHATHPLPALPFGDSDKQRVGDWVLAIGNPFGLGGTVTAGIISARGRDIQQGPYDDFIQTDAPINRGNSGGPLFDMGGEVIGMNTAIYSPSGGSIGIGFSIPSDIVKQVVTQLRRYGHARRGWLGVKIQSLTPDIAETLGLKEPDGALVANVEPNGPAANAKIQTGDVILKFNGQDVREMKNLPRIVAETDIDRQVPVDVWRDGKTQEMTVKVGELPESQVASATPAPQEDVSKPLTLSGLGLSLAPLTQEQRDKYSLPASQKGVLVTGVDGGSPASDKGLKAGDVIVEVSQDEVATPADVRTKVEQARRDGKNNVLMLVQGSDGLHWVPLSLKDSKRAPG